MDVACVRDLILTQNFEYVRSAQLEKRLIRRKDVGQKPHFRVVSKTNIQSFIYSSSYGDSFSAAFYVCA
jgi:hypothetical protein